MPYIPPSKNFDGEHYIPSKEPVHKEPKELCSSHGEETVDVTIACSGITSKVCINCGLELE
jgi:hypothetical protein